MAVSFAESISLSSTGPADLRLPPTAFASGFDLLALRARRKRESRRGQVLPQEVQTTKRAQFAEIQFSTFPQHTLQLVEIAPAPPASLAMPAWRSGRLGRPDRPEPAYQDCTIEATDRARNLSRVLHMPHMPRPPSVDHGVISLLWAIGLGAYIYYGSLAVGVSGGTAFIFAALGAFAIFVFVRVSGEQTPPRRYAARRRSQARTNQD